MNAPLAIQFEATDFMDPILLLCLIGAAVSVASVGVGMLLDKYNRINFSSLLVLCTVWASFTVTALAGTVIMSVNDVENPTDKRISNIEKAYEGVEVIDLTQAIKNDELVATLLVDEQTVTATLREDPETFEPTLYPYASEDAVKLEKVSSK